MERFKVNDNKSMYVNFTNKCIVRIPVHNNNNVNILYAKYSQKYLEYDIGKLRLKIHNKYTNKF